MLDRDEQQWRQWRQRGASEAFIAATQRYVGMVYSACKRRLRDEFAAEDAARAVFTELLHRRDDLSMPLALWLHSAAVRHAAERAAQAGTHAEVDAPGGEALEDRVPRVIDEAILALPEQLREAVVFRFLADFSVEHLADALETNEAAVRQRLAKAIDRLRAGLETQGIPLGAAALTGLLSAGLIDDAPASLFEAVRDEAVAAEPGGIAPELHISDLTERRRKRSSLLAMLLMLVLALGITAGGWWMFHLPPAASTGGDASTAAATPETTPFVPESSAIVGAGIPLEPGDTGLVIKEDPAAAQIPEGSGSIAGRLTESAAKTGIAGIPMGAFDRKLGAYAGTRVKSDAEGAYRIEKLPAGSYFVLPTDLGGYRLQGAQEGRSVEVKDGEALTGIDFTFESDTPPQEEFAIAGQVRDAAGQPIGDAFVSATGAVNASAFTAKDGSYRLSKLPEGYYNLSATKDRFRPANLTGVKAGASGADIALHQTATLGALVRSAATGQPIVQFEVDYLDEDTPGGAAELFKSPEPISSDNGGFVIEDLYPGKITLGVRAAGYKPAVQEVILGEGQKTEVTLDLEPEGKIEGRVVDSAGAPIAGAFLFVGPVPQGADWESRAAARTNDQGAFQLDSVPPAPGFVTAFHPDYAAAASSLQGSTTITLPDGGVLQGVVQQSGAPVTGAEVVVTPEGGDANLAVRTVTAADGAFKFLGLSPGLVIVQVTLAGHDERTEHASIRPKERTTLNIDLSAGAAQVSGAVTEAGAPVPGATVQLIAGAGAGQHTYETQTDVDGVYRFQTVPPGPAVLRVSHRGRQRGAEFEITSGQPVTRDIEFSGGSGAATITGTVTGYDLNSFGASILALQGDAAVPEDTGPGFFRALQPSLVAQCDVQPDGGYRLEGLSPGPYTIVAVIVPRTGQGTSAQIRRSVSKTTLTEGQTATLNFDFK